MAVPLEQIPERIRTILRRDLKLGAAAELPDSMLLIGGNMDLDSLDVLLLITNIEKEFGVKVASQDVGRQVFETIGSLIAFVVQKCSAGAAAAAGAASAGTQAADYLSQLPHRDPFRFISRVSKVEPGVSGEGVWTVSGSEAFFAGHFPGQPLVPGVLIAEALAQLAGIVGASAKGAPQQGKLAQVDVRFVQSVAPPAEIVLQARLTRSLGSLRQFDCMALYKGAPVAQGTITIAYAEAGK